MKKLISVLVLASACNATVEGTKTGDDTAGDDDGGDDDGGDDDGGGDTPTVRFAASSVRDERGDTVDFATGEPVHTHAGPIVALGGTTCPDVHKFTYLMDARTFGKETTPNPVQWNVEINGASGLDMTKAAYRVHGENGTVLDWTPLPALRGSIATINMPRGILPTSPSLDHVHFTIEVRTATLAGRESILSGCWTQYPLAAPIEVQQARPEPTGLFAMTLLTNSPISLLLAPSNNVAVFSQRFVHHTAEPVTLTIDLAQPTGAFSKRIVDDYVPSRTGSSGILCADDSGFESTDPGCSQRPPDDLGDFTMQGPLASGVWSMQVIEEATGAAAGACTVSGFHATCQLPSRGIAESAQAYRAVLSVRDVNDLATWINGPYAEHTIGGLTFTGTTLDTTQRCAQFQSITKLGFTIVTCRTFVEYTRIRALDKASITFGSVPFAITTSSNPLLPGATPPYVPASMQEVGATTWDAGDDDLPGPN